MSEKVNYALHVVRMCTYLFIGYLCVFASSSVGAEEAVRLNAYQRGAAHDIFVSSSASTVISVVVDLSGTNIALDRTWPQVLVVPPGATIELGRIHSADPRQGYQFSTRYSFKPGDYRVNDAPEPPCRLPYADGLAFALGQVAYGHLSSHDDPLTRQAIDIGMPEGTPIAVVRDGVVTEVVDRFTAGGWEAYYKDKANQVTVVHDDGRVSVYAHMAHHSARVFVGQRVRAGEILGLSGNTGYSSGPHLHFAMMRPKLGEDRLFRLEAIPVHFYVGSPARILVPVAGMAAEAVYDRPAKVVYRSDVSPQHDLQRSPDDPVADLHLDPGAERTPIEATLIGSLLDFANKQWLGLGIGISIFWLLGQILSSLRRKRRRCKHAEPGFGE